MGLGHFGLGCGCCCDCSSQELWACHGGTVKKISDGALHLWPLSCCATFNPGMSETACGGQQFLSTGTYYTNDCCQTNPASVCGANGATLFVRMTTWLDVGSCCRQWTIQSAVTCNVGGMPVVPLPGAFSTRTVTLDCDSIHDVEMAWPLGPVNLACSLSQPGIPIRFANHSGVSCGCS